MPSQNTGISVYMMVVCTMYGTNHGTRYAFFGLLLLPFPHPERTKVRVVGRYSESSVSPQISFSRRGGVRRARNAPQTFGRSMIA